MHQCPRGFAAGGAARLDIGAEGMTQRVFVKIVGFTDEERHALNLLFRMSEEQGTAFAPWEPHAPEAPTLALLDGQSHEAQLEMQNPRNADLRVVWVGDGAPPTAVRVFQRPIAWPQVVLAMDELFPPALDFDLDFDQLDTQPPVDSEQPLVQRRALICAADRDERLYMRAKLSLAGLVHADEAETAAQALEFARANDYVLAIADFDLPGAGGWKFVRELSAGPRRIPFVIVTAGRPSLAEHVRAWFAPVAGFFAKPPHPGKLHDLLLQA